MQPRETGPPDVAPARKYAPRFGAIGCELLAIPGRAPGGGLSPDAIAIYTLAVVDGSGRGEIEVTIQGRPRPNVLALMAAFGGSKRRWSDALAELEAAGIFACLGRRACGGKIYRYADRNALAEIAATASEPEGRARLQGQFRPDTRNRDRDQPGLFDADTQPNPTLYAGVSGQIGPDYRVQSDPDVHKYYKSLSKCTNGPTGPGAQKNTGINSTLYSRGVGSDRSDSSRPASCHSLPARGESAPPLRLRQPQASCARFWAAQTSEQASAWRRARDRLETLIPRPFFVRYIATLTFAGSQDGTPRLRAPESHVATRVRERYLDLLREFFDARVQVVGPREARAHGPPHALASAGAGAS